MSKATILFCLLNKQNRIVVFLINSRKHIAFLDDLVLKNLLPFEKFLLSSLPWSSGRASYGAGTSAHRVTIVYSKCSNWGDGAKDM